jgi:hypothetical protein
MNKRKVVFKFLQFKSESTQLKAENTMRIKNNLHKKGGAVKKRQGRLKLKRLK